MVDTTLRARIVADVSDYEEGMKKADKSTGKWKEGLKKTKKAVEETGKATSKAGKEAKESTEKASKAIDKLNKSKEKWKFGRNESGQWAIPFPGKDKDAKKDQAPAESEPEAPATSEKKQKPKKKSVLDKPDEVIELEKKELEELEEAEEDVIKPLDAWKKALSALSPSYSELSDKFDDIKNKTTDVAKSSKKGFGSMATKLTFVGLIAKAVVGKMKQLYQQGSELAQMWNNTAYDKGLEKKELGIKKLKTALGGFLAPIINNINKFIGWFTSGLATILKYVYAGIIAIYRFFKTLLEPMFDALRKVIDWVVSGIKALVNAIAGLFGFGPVFGETTKSAEEASDAIEDVGEQAEYTEGSLHSYDKLNTTSDITGDTATVEDMTSLADEWGDLASGFASDLLDGIGKVVDKVKGIFNLDWKGLWGKICKWGGDAWETIKTKAGEVWDSVTEWAGGLWDGFCQWGGEAWDTICSYAGQIWESIKSTALFIWNAFLTGAQTCWDAIVSFATTCWNAIVSVATSIWDAILGVASAVWNAIQAVALGYWNALKSVVEAWWNYIQWLATTVWNVISTVATTVWDAISKPILALWSAFQEAGETCWSYLDKIGRAFNKYVIDPIKSAIDWCVSKIEWLLDKISGIKDAIGGIIDTIGNIGGSIVNGVKGVLGFASGGVVDPNDPHLVVVGDNKREQEVISPVSTIKQAVAEVLSSGGYSNNDSKPVNITLEIDGKTLARYTYDDYQREGKRRGTIA